MKKCKIIIIFVIILCLGIGGVTGYIILKNKDEKDANQELHNKKNSNYENVGNLKGYEELYAKAKAIGDKYDVVIAIADQVPDYALNTGSGLEYKQSERLMDKEKINYALDKVDKILSIYPKNFFSQLKYDDLDSMRIFIIGFCSSGMGVAPTNDNFHYIVMDAEDYGLIDAFDYNLNHEISHIIDKTLAHKSEKEPGHLYSEEKWKSYNPPDFIYTVFYNDQQKQNEEYEKYSEYFAYSYGTYNSTEDRATIFGQYMNAYMNFEDFTSVLPEKAMLKLDYYCECIRDGFDTTGWPELTPWEHRAS